MRYYWYIQFTIFKCNLMCSKNVLQSCNHHHHRDIEHFISITIRDASCPFVNNLLSYPWPLENPDLIFITTKFENFAFSKFSCLACFIQHNVFEIHQHCAYQQFFNFLLNRMPLHEYITIFISLSVVEHLGHSQDFF